MHFLRGSVVLLIACTLSLTWALRCYECEGCGALQNERPVTCEEGEKCSKIVARYPAVDVTVVAKSCMVDVVSCSDLEELVDLSTQLNLVKQNYGANEMGHVKMECNYCDTDLCNGSPGVIHSPIFMASCLLTSVLIVRGFLL